MFASAGNPGIAKILQGNLAAARKVFRIMRPLEQLNALFQNPRLSHKRPLWLDLLDKLRPICMAVYFGADHVVWAKQAGLKKTSSEKAGRVSMYGWAVGSFAGFLVELHDIVAFASRKPTETAAEYAERLDASKAELNRRAILVLHLALQSALATGLLGFTGWSQRTIGAIGTATSALNCYMLFPALSAFLPKRIEAPKPNVKIA